MSFAGGSVLGISIKYLSFAYNDTPLFKNLTLVPEKENPLVILGPSGCGKTTLLKLIAGLLRPDAGEINFIRSAGVSVAGDLPLPADPVKTGPAATGACSFVFQEPRLLPWKTVLKNVMLPMEQSLGKTGAEERARHFLRQVSLEDRVQAFPGELSGGQKQRVSFARAFAFPGRGILMDEPFQSLDIPLRIQLMDLTLSLLAESPRLAVIVTHDPREAVYLGQRILVLGKPPAGFVFDETPDLERGNRVFGSGAQIRMERRLIEVLSFLRPVREQ
ncbi:MAG: ABC transporter ATP-binding protein [Spirochaetaceae bacterium]|nr:ABC transporter ATP-binding protein [Spirochaetaceae bacterium]